MVMRRIKKWAFMITASMIICFALSIISFAEEKMEKQENLESVYLNLPEVFAYGEFKTGDEENIEGYLGQERLEYISSQEFKDTGQSIYYYILLDISGSMPQNYFSDIKDGILEFQKSLREQDQLILCSFGEEVTLLCDGKQTGEELEVVLERLLNKDQKTLLFEAMSQISHKASAVKAEENRRKVMIVFSDGEDIAIGKKMAQEAQRDLQEKGIPVYAMCIADTRRENINSFGEFARMTGGDLTLIKNGEAKVALESLRERLLSMEQLTFQATDNKVTNQMITFTLRAVASDKTFSKEVMDIRWIPDTVEPEILEVTQVGERQICLLFSEPVIGTENPLNYTVLLGDETVAISGISGNTGRNNQVILTLSEDFKTGEYKILCSNITDDSMEKNPISNVGLLYIEKAGVEMEDDKPEYTGILFLIFVTLLLLIFIILIKTSKKGKPEKPDSSPNIKEKQTPVKIDGPLHIKEELVLNVEIRMEGKKPIKLEWPIVSSLIVGRQKGCDIQLDNKLISKQHFALEKIGQDLFIMDLGSTNGTKLNQKGLIANAKAILRSGDIIQAGTVEICIRW